MTFLLYDLNGSLIINDIRFYLERMGHKCNYVLYLLKDKCRDDQFCGEMRTELSRNKYDAVFTTNYYPIVAQICYECSILYYSWSYDSPPEIQTLETMDYPTNRIFFFSKYDYKHFREDCGIDNVYYLPLAVNIERLSKIRKNGTGYTSDVSLVGGLYHSKFLELRKIMSDEQKKYVDAVIQVQLKHSGCGVVEAAINDDFVKSVCEFYRQQSETAVQPSKESLFYYLCAHITHLDRVSVLRICAEKGYRTNLYLGRISDGDKELLSKKGVILNPSVSYEEGMPQVFMSSKINLNPTLRANRTGINLRIVDVLGTGEFLLTTHQQELDDFFYEDEIVTYETLEEEIEKIAFYLDHDDIRDKIAKKGQERVKKDFNYVDRLNRMLSF